MTADGVPPITTSKPSLLNVIILIIMKVKESSNAYTTDFWPPTERAIGSSYT